MDSTVDFAKTLAMKAGKLLLDYFKPTGIQVNIKSDLTVITEADLASDRFITENIHKEFPSDGILSEEKQTEFPTGKQFVWVIDPLDGTTNFSLGLPIWGVSIARLESGTPTLGVLYFPLLDELYYAQSNNGAYLNERPLEVQPPRHEQPTTFFSCCSRSHRRYEIEIPYKTRIMGSATYNLCSVARGSAVLSLDVIAKVWDISAGMVIVSEAGGVVDVLEGNFPFPLVSGFDYGALCIPTLGAASNDLLTRAHKQIKLKSDAEKLVS